METVFVWSGFIGAWLLFSGALYQSIFEVRQDAAVLRQPIEKPSEHPMQIPPLGGKPSRAKAIVLNNLTSNQYQAMRGFYGKVTGWQFVALGAWAALIEETTGLMQHYQGGLIHVVAIVIVLTAVAVAVTTFTLRRWEDAFDKRHPVDDTGTATQ